MKTTGIRWMRLDLILGLMKPSDMGIQMREPTTLIASLLSPAFAEVKLCGMWRNAEEYSSRRMAS